MCGSGLLRIRDCTNGASGGRSGTQPAARGRPVRPEGTAAGRLCATVTTTGLVVNLPTAPGGAWRGPYAPMTSRPGISPGVGIRRAPAPGLIRPRMRGPAPVAPGTVPGSPCQDREPSSANK